MTKHIAPSIGMGYAYEKSKYSDAHLDGYTLIPTDGGAFLPGAYSDQSYKAKLYIATIAYKFW